MRVALKALPAASLAALWLAGGASAASVAEDAAPPPDVEAYADSISNGDVLALNVFEGDFTGDGVKDAIAFTYYAGGGNAAYLDVSLFVGQDGKLVHKRVVDKVYGEQPHDVDIAKGRIQVTMAVLKPGDPRCCPTGKKRYTIRP